MARASNGKFILRIDDTDLKRSDPKYTTLILDTLKWLNLDYDQLVFQSNRFELYKNYIKKVPTITKDNAIFLNPNNLNFPNSWYDEISGEIKITQNDISNLNIVLIKQDGSPSYNWASVIDDIELNINYIIRGTDHITNTSKQVILFHLLNANIPKFAHVGLISQNNKLLSKRDDSFSISNLQEYHPDAILNFVARSGWGPKKDDKTTKILTKEKMLELFINHGNLRNSQSNLDLDKLKSYDRKYKAM